MESTAKLRYVRMSPRKVRRVVDLIRGKKAGEALLALRFMPYKAARPVEKLLKSAMSNAEQADSSVDVETEEMIQEALAKARDLSGNLTTDVVVEVAPGMAPLEVDPAHAPRASILPWPSTHRPNSLLRRPPHRLGSARPGEPDHAERRGAHPLWHDRSATGG